MVDRFLEIAFDIIESAVVLGLEKFSSNCNKSWSLLIVISPTNLHFSTIFRLWNLARSMASFVGLKNITSVLVLFNFRLEIDENFSMA